MNKGNQIHTISFPDVFQGKTKKRRLRHPRPVDMVDKIVTGLLDVR